MDEYDGETFQFEGEFTRDFEGRPWAEGPGSYYFDLAWLSPATAPAPEEPPQEPSAEAPTGVTGFGGVSLDADEYKWRVPDVNDIGKRVEVREFDSSEWCTRRLVAILGVYGDEGRYVCKGDGLTRSYLWKHARVSNKQQPEAWEPQPGDCVRVTEGSLKGKFGVVLSGARPRTDQSQEPRVEENPDYRWIWIPRLGGWYNKVHKRNLAPA
jgi:hypothetical protein